MKKIKLKIDNNQKGITLIALVITIIVLLILAGVTINLAIDANGLFSRANEATTKWNNRVEQEGESIQNVLDMAEKYLGGDGNTLPSGWEESKVAGIVREEDSEVAGVVKDREAPIPNGFVASEIPGEGTITSGLVIYETGNDDTTSEDFWTKTTEVGESQVPEVQTKYNQYVWIPVDDINSMIMCEDAGENGSDAEGSETTVCHIVLENGQLVCEVHEDSTVLVGRLYTSSSTGDGTYSYIMDFSKKDQTYNPNSGSREPAVVTGSSTGDGTYNDGASDNYHGAGSASAFLTQLQNDFYTMVKSVYTYGGFYISRYEVGENGNSKKDQKRLTAASRASDSVNYLAGNMWYGLYNTLRKAGTTTTPNSHMIWGSQYDQVIKFIGSEAQTGHSDGRVTTSQLQSGGTTDILKNIYDLEGNLREWTAEANDTSYRVARGRILHQCKP